MDIHDIHIDKPLTHICTMCNSRNYKNSSKIRSQLWVQSKRLIMLMIKRRDISPFNSVLEQHVPIEFEPYLPRQIVGKIYRELNKRELAQVFSIAIKQNIPVILPWNDHVSGVILNSYLTLPKILKRLFGSPKTIHSVNMVGYGSKWCHNHTCPSCYRCKSSRLTYCKKCIRIGSKAIIVRGKKRTLDEMMNSLSI